MQWGDMSVLERLKCYLLAEQSRWILWVPVCFGTGIGIYFALPFEPSKWLILIILELFLVASYFLRGNRYILFVLQIIGLIACGFANVQLQTVYLSTVLPKIEEGRVYLSGRISHLDKNYRGNPRIILDDIRSFSEEEVPGNYRLSLIHKQDDLKVGQCVEMVAEVSPPFKTSMAGGFQFDRQLFFEGINASGYVPSRVLPVDCPEGDSSWHFADYAARLRSHISDYISEVLPPEEAAVAVAIVAGDRTKMSKELVASYRDSGLAHFLSISGLHMSMLAGLMFFFIRLLMALIPPLALRYNSKKVAAVWALFISLIYLVISGAAIPSQRAFIMTFVVLLAVLFDRRAISMRTLAWAAMVVLVISPQALVSASFQMSFAAVVALVAFYERFAGKINNFVSIRDDTPAIKAGCIIILYFVGVVVSDLVASLATTPYAIYHFNRVALYTSLTNVVAGPIIGFVIMPFVLLALLVMPFGLAFLPLKIVGAGIAAVNALTVWVSSLPNAGMEIVSMPTWGIIMITFGGLWLCLWGCRWRHWGWLAILIGILSIAAVKVPDVIVDAKGKTVIVKNELGELVALPGGNKWNKQVWLSKYAAAEEARVDKNVRNRIFPRRLKLIKKQGLFLDGEKFDLETAGGASFYEEDNGEISWETVRDDIGLRPWNQ